MSISDLLGLNVPRGTLLGSNNNLNSPPLQLYESPPTSRFMQEQPQFLEMVDTGIQASIHNYPRALRNSPPYSDGGSPTSLEHSLLQSCSHGGSSPNSPADSESSPRAIEATNLANIMHYLTLYGCNDQQQEQLTSSLNSLRLLQQQQQQQNLQANFLSQLLLPPTPPEPRSPPCFQGRTLFGTPSRQGQQTPQSPQQLLLSPELSSPLQWQPPTPAPSVRGSQTPDGTASTPNVSLERAARFHKSAASLSDATCTWSGTLPPRSKTGVYSCKVFLGGVPWDMGEAALVNALKQFGQIRIEWPGKDQAATQPKGYVYVILESERRVKELLNACIQEVTGGGNWYLKISSKKMKAKEVQVIPWHLNDSNYMKYTSQRLDPHKTVFVGALHGMLNAEGLAKIMNDLFGGVIYAGIDTDKYKYPIGSGRVTFNNPRSYMRAVAAGFIEIKTPRFTKKVQVDPYLEDSLCSSCWLQQGPYFCRDMACFRYFCRTCWHVQHVGREHMQAHKPMMRYSKAMRPPAMGQWSSPPTTSPSLSK